MIGIQSIGLKALAYGLGNACIRLGSFLLIPLYTHSLSIADYGLLMTVFVTVQVMVILTGLGTPTGFMRFSGECDRRGDLGRLVSSTILLQLSSCLTLTVLAVSLLNPLFQRLFHSEEVLVYLLLAGAVALCLSLFENSLALFRVRGQWARFLLSCIAIFVLLVTLTVLMVNWLHLGVVGALAAQVLSYGTLWMINLASWRRQLHFGWSRTILKTLFRFSFPLVFSSASSILADVSSVYFLSLLLDFERVSIFSLAQKISGMAGILLILPFQLAYEPFVYRNIDSPSLRETIARLLVFLLFAYAVTAAGIVYLSRDGIRLLAPPEYAKAYTLIFWMLPALAFRCMYYIGESLAGIAKKTRQVALLITSANLVSVLVGYELIGHFGLEGAVAGYMVSMFLTGYSLLLLGIRYHPIPLQWMHVIIAFGFMGSVLGFMFWLGGRSTLLFYTGAPLLGLLVWGGLVYFMLLKPAERDMIRHGVKRLINREKNPLERLAKQPTKTTWIP